MKYTIKGYTRRINGGYLYVVETKPNWFERILLRKRTKMHELAVPKKIAANAFATAKLMYHHLSKTS